MFYRNKIVKQFFSLLLINCFFVIVTMAQTKLDWVSKVGATTFPSSQKIFNVNRYGAKVNDISVTATKFIQEAIDDCAKQGGGIVTFNSGVYKMGAIYLRSNVHLRIDKDVLILGSQNFDDYPEMDTRIAGIEMKWPAALINIIDVKNAAVTGEGIVNARGKFCWDKYWKMRKDYDAKGLRWIVDYDAKRVRTCLVQNSSNITLKKITFKNAGFWTVQLLYSQHLTVDGVIIKNNEDGNGPSTDGIDIDSSTWTLIENCDIDCNDDNFCLKSGRDWDGLRVNRPTEYVVIRKCLARKGGGLVTLGSETSGGILHVLATDLTARHTDNGLRIKSATTRGGTIEDIYFQNITMDSVKFIFNYTLNWNPSYSYSELPKGIQFDSIPAHWKSMLQKVTPVERGIPHAKDIYIDNVNVSNAQNIFTATGLEQSYLTNFVYSNSNLQGDLLGVIEFTKGWKFYNVVMDVNKSKPITKPQSKEVEERLKQ